MSKIPEVMDELKSFLDKICPLTDEEWKKTNSAFQSRHITKGAFFVESGKTCKKIGFIKEGLFRLFYRVNGEEKTMLFFQENQIFADYFSFLTQTPSIRPIEALEDSTIYTLSHEKLQELYEFSPNWQKIGRFLSEYAYIYAVERSNRLLHDDSDTRYITFLQETPALLQRVPQHLIASYLNMAPETLSRVKKRVHKKHPALFQSIHQPSSGNPLNFLI